jgi:hypothetical protein
MQAGCRLVMAGHAAVWEYPWELFHIALDELGKK